MEMSLLLKLVPWFRLELLSFCGHSSKYVTDVYSLNLAYNSEHNYNLTLVVSPSLINVLSLRETLSKEVQESSVYVDHQQL